MSAYYTIEITDIKFHTELPRKPHSFMRAASKSIRSGKPGRAYSTDMQLGDNSFMLNFPFVREEAEKARLAGKELRILFPKNGIPVYLGDDLIARLKTRDEKTAERAWTLRGRKQ